MLTVTTMYIYASFILTGTVNYAYIDLYAPFSAAMRAVNLPVISKLVGIGTALGMIKTTILGFTAQPRIFVSMGMDGFLPHAFAFSTRSTTLGFGVFVYLLSLIIDTQVLTNGASGGTLLAILSTNSTTLLRRCRIHSSSRRVPMLVNIFSACCALTAMVATLVLVAALTICIDLSVSLQACLIPATMLL